MSNGLRFYWPKTFLLVFALTLLWSLATPLFAAPDEPAHVLKAVAAARGQLAGTAVTGEPSAVTKVTVPAGYGSAGQVPACFDASRAQPAGCAKDLVYVPGLVEATTYVGHYPALYYLLVGWPSRLVPSPDRAIYAMRFVSGALSSAFVSLAIALVLANKRKDPPPLIGLLIAFTPQALFLASVVNPAGLAISAALCLWTAGLVLVGSSEDAQRAVTTTRTAAAVGLDDRAQHQRGVSVDLLLLIVAVCALVEAFTIALGPLWVGLTGLVLLASTGPARRRQLLGRGSTWLTAAVVVVGLSAASLLVRANGSLDVLGSSRTVPPGTPFPVVVARSLSWLPVYVAQAIGAMGWLETRPPLLTYLIWGVLLAGVAVAAIRFGSRQIKLVLLFLGVAAILAPTLIPASQAASLGSIVWEGKDGMPLWVGLPLLATSASVTWWSRHQETGRYLMGAAGVAQFAAFLGALHRYTVGSNGPWTMAGRVADAWSPPLPPLILVALYGAFLLLSWGSLLYGPFRQRRDGRTLSPVELGERS